MTVAEAVEHLMARSTFRGFVAWQKESYVGPLDNGWVWRSINCDPVMTTRALAKCIALDADPLAGMTGFYPKPPDGWEVNDISLTIDTKGHEVATVTYRKAQSSE